MLRICVNPRTGMIGTYDEIKDQLIKDEDFNTYAEEVIPTNIDVEEQFDYYNQLVEEQIYITYDVYTIKNNKIKPLNY